ncbi:MAG: PAS domain S-box protein [Gammaproteobacteria bacterium]|nr:PAS domain S-box protein [Gammaproteobacteria bacterium]
MQRIFSPAVTLLNRMSYTRKFTLLWLVSLIAVAVVTYSLFTSLDRVIQPSQRELQGLSLIEPISRTVQLIQLHRGYSAALLGGVEGMRDRRAAIENQVESAIQNIETTLPPDLSPNLNLQRIRHEWMQLRKQGLGRTMAANFAAHTHLIRQIQSFESFIADEYALILDSEIATFYLIDAIVNRLPPVLENLGQLRAYGTGVLAGKQISATQRAQLNTLLGKFDNALDQLRLNLDKTTHYNSSVKESVQAAYADIAESAGKITAVIEADILSSRFDTPAGIFLDMATVDIDNGYTQMHEALLPTAVTLIEARIAEAEKTLFLTTGIALLLFLLLVYISIGIYYAIVGNIQTLVRAAHTFANGDLSRRIKLNSRDELGQVGHSFNRMADGFSAMLEARNQAEEELQEAMDKFQSLVESSSDWIWEVDANTTYTYASPKVTDLLGYEPHEVIGKSPFDFMPAEEQANFDEFYETVFQKRKPFAGFENNNLHKDGHLVFLETSGVPAFDKEGVFCGYRGIDRDITQRKQDHKEIELRRKDFKNIFNSTNDGVFIHDLQGNFIDINRTAYQRLGYSKAELLAKNISDLVAPEFNAERPVRMSRIMEQGMAVFESAHRCKDGSNMPVEVNARLIEWHGEQVILCAGRDITERKLAEDKLIRLNATLEARVEERTSELQLARDQADAANQAKSHFLSNMSHEIRSPLSAIIGFSESLQTDVLSPAERNKTVSTVVRNARHLLQVINDVLDLSKIEAGQLKIEQISTPVFLLLEDVDSLLGMNARDKGLEFRITYHFPLPETIVTDPVRLKQILFNLCSNAIKFTDKGSIEIEVSYDPEFSHLKLTVSDSGIGMSAEAMAHIFDPFTQADATVTRKYGGTGLGLSISLKLATALGGELKCESQKGQGSRFMLTVANHDQAQMTAINRLEEVSLHLHEPDDQVDIKPLIGHILLVEDSPDNQQLVSMYIQKTGAQLSIAENGLQAITIAREQAFDLILMDMQMPVMGGLEAMRQLRAGGYTRPIVALSADALLSDQEECKTAGADDYLTKPIEQSKFYQVLNTYLDKSTTTSEKNREREEAMRESPQYQAVVARFLDTLPQTLDEIKMALDEKSWETVQAKTHDLKGIGGAMGYPKITELAGEANTLAKRQNYEQLADAWVALKEHCHVILDNNRQT